MPALYPRPVIHGRDHMPGGPDPIPGLPDARGDDIDDIILGLPGLAAFWRLDEPSGTIAHDSSGNGHNLTATGSYVPPDWGQPDGPPGRQTAGWGTASTRVAGSLTAFTNNFTAGIWVNADTLSISGIDALLGQGLSIHGGSNDGWCLAFVSVGGGNDKFAMFIDGAVHYANNNLAADTWYFLAVVRDSGTWKLYVNGLLQADTGTESPGTAHGSNTWIGNDDFAGTPTYFRDGLLCYGFIATSVLTSTELLEIYNAPAVGQGGQAAGDVLMSDGMGGSSFQPNINTLSHTGDAELTGDVTLTAGTNVTITQTGQDITIAAAGSSPASDTQVWMPLVDSDGTVVLDSNGVIPTLITL